MCVLCVYVVYGLCRMYIVYLGVLSISCVVLCMLTVSVVLYVVVYVGTIWSPGLQLLFPARDLYFPSDLSY